MVDVGNIFEVAESSTTVVYRKFVIEFIIAVAAEAVEVKFLGPPKQNNSFAIRESTFLGLPLFLFIANF